MAESLIIRTETGAAVWETVASAGTVSPKALPSSSSNP